MKLAIFTSLFLLALVAGIHGACSYTDGHTYDLSTLTKPSSGGTAGNNYNSYFFETSNGNRDYFVNICAQSAAPCNTPGAVCLRDSTGGAPVYYNCGNADYQIIGSYSDPAQHFGAPPPAGGGVSITYEDGQFCSNSNPIRRQTTISIACNHDLKLGEGIIVAAQEYETCKYSILMQAQEACTMQLPPINPPVNPPPNIPTFSSEIFLAASFITDDDDVVHHVSSMAAVGNFYWDATQYKYLFNGTQTVPSTTTTKVIGSLAHYETLLEISKIDDKCYYQTINHRMLNASKELTYAGKGTYQYLKFNAGKEVQVDRYIYKDFKNDGDIKPMLLIDSQSKEYVYADMAIFFYLFNQNSYYKGDAQPAQWMEFNSATWSTSPISPLIFTIPNAWQCAKKK